MVDIFQVEHDILKSVHIVQTVINNASPGRGEAPGGGNSFFIFNHTAHSREAFVFQFS